MNYIRVGKFLLAIIFTCGLLGLLPATAKAQRTMAPSTSTTTAQEDQGQDAARRQGRIAPPTGLRCDINHVTSFTGRVLAYSRHSGRIFIRVHTDEQTTNEFTIPYAEGEDVSKWFMIDGQALAQVDDLAKIESRLKRKKRSMRATVWACYDNDWRKTTAEIIDWRPRERNTRATY
jgi:hypothetical protein